MDNTDDLIQRLRTVQHDGIPLGLTISKLLREAADRIAALEAECTKLAAELAEAEEPHYQSSADGTFVPYEKHRALAADLKASLDRTASLEAEIKKWMDEAYAMGIIAEGRLREITRARAAGMEEAAKICEADKWNNPWFSADRTWADGCDHFAAVIRRAAGGK